MVVLDHSYRFSGAIATLAEAIRAGDGEVAVATLRSGAPEVELVDDAGVPDVRDDVVSAAVAQRAAAERGDADAALALLERHRLLCAHRTGPYGVEHWGGWPSAGSRSSVGAPPKVSGIQVARCW